MAFYNIHHPFVLPISPAWLVHRAARERRVLVGEMFLYWDTHHPVEFMSERFTKLASAEVSLCRSDILG